MSTEHGRLNGWKDIAAFLDRSVRTVQRWEREYSLPVHRQGPDGELIFAYRDELDAWVRAGGSRAQVAVHEQLVEAEQVHPLRRTLAHAVERLATVRGNVYRLATPAVKGRDDRPRVQLGPHCLIWDDRTFPLREGVTVVGRADDADVQILVPSISRHHARILIRGLEATLEDLGSRHGTWRGATRVQGATPLASGDEIRLGTALLVYRFVRSTDETL
jgi:hypothetical protein